MSRTSTGTWSRISVCSLVIALVTQGLLAAVGSSASAATPTAALLPASGVTTAVVAPPTATTDESVSAVGSGPSIADGTFVVVGESGQVYRVVGGAPVYVSSWTPFGGPQPVVSVTAAQLAAMPLTPADGTFVIGSSGRGSSVYRFAGGAPIYVGFWGVFGGEQPAILVDQAALDHAGRGGVWNHVRAYPADGTFVVGVRGGEVYRFAGGAPIYVSGWSPFGAEQPVTVVDEIAFGSGGWGHVRDTPADGTFVVGARRGEVYRFAGGAPIYVSQWSAFGGPQPVTVVDDAALDAGGQGGQFRHVRRNPVDGTFVVGGRRGEVYRFAGGAPIYVSQWSAFGGPQPVTVVDDAALDLAGLGQQFSHVRFSPVDGTILLGEQTGRVYRVGAGVALYVASWDQVGGPQPTAGVDQAAIDRAGQGGPFNHLTGVGVLP